MTTWPTVYKTLFGKPLNQDDVAAWEAMFDKDFGPTDGLGDDIIQAMRGMHVGKFAPVYGEVKRAVENLYAEQRSAINTGCKRCHNGWMRFHATREGDKLVGFTIAPDPIDNSTTITCLCDQGEAAYERQRVSQNGKTPEVADHQDKRHTNLRRAIFDAIGEALFAKREECNANA